MEIWAINTLLLLWFYVVEASQMLTFTIHYRAFWQTFVMVTAFTELAIFMI
jgi:hypothetical protein